MIQVMDRGIGELMAELARLNLAEKTVVIFASDNGPDPLTGHRFNQSHRGTKYEVNEGGIRVPLMVRWPDRYQARTVSGVVHFVDLFPTILEICGAKVPATVKIDGSSFCPLLRGESRSVTPRFWQWNRGEPNYTHNAAMRDGPWKLVRPYVTRKVNPGDSKRSPELFNLSKDPGEAHDLSDVDPERTELMNDAMTDWSRHVERDRRREDRGNGQVNHD